MKRIIASIYGRMQMAYFEYRYDSYRKKYNIRTNFGFNGTDIRLYGEGNIEIGNNSYIGNYSTIQLTPGTKVIIGDNCQISHNVRMYTSSADPDQDFTIQKTKPSKIGDIIIGNGVWIGANVFINPGIIIGNNSVIGANSVVTKDVSVNAIVGGAPAKLIRFKNI
jgi:maltose O-acetyltransferase